MLSIHAAGDWPPQKVDRRIVASTRPIIAEVEQLIDSAWHNALQRDKLMLFDGPMARFESWEVSAERLSLAFSTTSYKPFLGTNLMHPEVADRHGRIALANPAGVSPGLLTADGYLMFGQRNLSVAYYPGRTHPFAGAMEPRDEGDVFAAVRRELSEELRLRPEEISEVNCTGIVEDWNLRQYELIFRAVSTRTRTQIEGQLDPAEHGGSCAVRAARKDIELAIKDPRFTPVAHATMLLWGATRWGDQWMRNCLQSIAAPAGAERPAVTGES